MISNSSEEGQIIHKLQPIHSLYKVNVYQIDQFLQLLDHYQHYKILLPPFAHGTTFHWQLAFDLYFYLSTPEHKISLNIQRIIDNPFSVYVHQLLTDNLSIKSFKRIVKYKEPLLVIFTLILTKRILASIEWDFAAPIHLPCDPYSTDNKHMQHELLIEFKQSLKLNKSFSKIVEDTILESKILYNFMEVQEVNQSESQKSIHLE